MNGDGAKYECEDAFACCNGNQRKDDSNDATVDMNALARILRLRSRSFIPVKAELYSCEGGVCGLPLPHRTE